MKQKFQKLKNLYIEKLQTTKTLINFYLLIKYLIFITMILIQT